MMRLVFSRIEAPTAAGECRAQAQGRRWSSRPTRPLEKRCEASW